MTQDVDDLVIQTEQEDDVCILRFVGELNVFNLPHAEEALSRVIQNRRFNVIIDLAGLTYLDSSGIGFLTGAMKRLYEKGGDLKLTNPTAYVERVFQVLHLDYFLDVYGNMEEAMDHFRGNVAKAILKWQKILEMKPNYADAYYKLALTYRNSGMLEEALAEVAKALAVNNDYVEALNLRGELLLARQQTDEAEQVFKRVLELAPRDMNGLLNLALCYGDRNLLDEAIAAFRSTLQLYPRYADLYFHLAHALVKKGESAEALSVLKEAVVLNPAYLDAHRLQARICMESGDNDGARDALKRIMALSLDEKEIKECERNISLLRENGNGQAHSKTATGETQSGSKRRSG